MFKKRKLDKEDDVALIPQALSEDSKAGDDNKSGTTTHKEKGGPTKIRQRRQEGQQERQKRKPKMKVEESDKSESEEEDDDGEASLKQEDGSKKKSRFKRAFDKDDILPGSRRGRGRPRKAESSARGRKKYKKVRANLDDGSDDSDDSLGD